MLNVLPVLWRVESAAVDVSDRRNPVTSSRIVILAQNEFLVWLRDCGADHKRADLRILLGFSDSRIDKYQNASCGLRIKSARNVCTHLESQRRIYYRCDHN